jgi:hypothetical protein
MRTMGQTNSSSWFLPLKLNLKQYNRNIYQTEFKPISKHQFEISEAMRILSIRHVVSK